jgi:hypothetical protein
MRLDAVQIRKRLGGEVTLPTIRTYPNRNVLDDEQSAATPIAPGEVT